MIRNKKKIDPKKKILSSSSFIIYVAPGILYALDKGYIWKSDGKVIWKRLKKAEKHELVLFNEIKRQRKTLEHISNILRNHL